MYDPLLKILYATKDGPKDKKLQQLPILSLLSNFLTFDIVGLED